MKIYQDVIEAYKDICKMLLASKEVIVRGLKTKEIVGHSFRILNVNKMFELERVRKRYMFAEMFWYLAGTYNVNEIAPFSKFWLKIADENGYINSNYGHRIFRDEKTFFKALKQLEKDKYTRQAIVHINLPKDIRIDNKDIPCTLFLHFLVRNDQLNLIVYMRSNDIYKGFTYDFVNFIMFQNIMLYFLKNKYPELKLGWYQHIAGSLHVYETDFERIKKYTNDKINSFKLEFNENLIDRTGQTNKKIKGAFKEMIEEPDKVFDYAFLVLKTTN